MKHCEGVAKNLESQLKKVLRTFNYSFACAEGLENTLQEKEKREKEL